MKKGFSLTEVVVAMAVAVIISMLCYATCNFVIMQSAKSSTKSFFVSQTQNYVTCYYLGEDGYANAIKLLTGNDVVFGQNATMYYAKNLSISDDSNFEYYVNLNFESEKFVVRCFSNSGMEPFFEVEV